MSFGNSQFITIGLIAVFFIAIAIFFFDNGFFVGQKKESEDNDDDLLEEGEADSSTIFYMYDHSSSADWLRWINTQDKTTKDKALALLKAHLESPAKEWGYVTLEVLDCLNSFPNHSLDQTIANFFERCTKSWREYKSVPNYFYKAAETLINSNKVLALDTFKKEILKKGSSQGALERRRAIIDHLPDLKEKCKDLMVDILTSPVETYGTKVYALRKCEKLNTKLKSEIHLEVLKRIVNKYKNSIQEMKTEETHFIQDLMEECIRNISNIEFFKVLDEASRSDRFQRFVIKQVLKVLNNPNKVQNQYDLLAMCRLRDNRQHDIKRTIGKIHQLDPAEINNIVLQPVTKNLKKNELIYSDNDALMLPIPLVMEREYEEFKSVFFQNIDDHDYVTSEKIYGGVLITGDEPIEKMYFARALAKEKGWKYACIDVSKINDKASYDKTCEIYNKLRKPYLLYIINPHTLFERDGSEESVLREKFVQMLTIQSLDTKSFLAGDILATNDQITQSSISDRMSSLKAKFFPQSLTMNKKAEIYKNTIIEEYIKFVVPRRFENRKELISQLLDEGKHMSCLEFCFYVIKTLKVMLLIFGKDCKLSEITELEQNFLNLNLDAIAQTLDGDEDEVEALELNLERQDEVAS